MDIDTGIGTADEAGNALQEGVDYVYNADERSYYALNLAVTAENYQDFTDSTKIYEPVSAQLDEGSHATKNVWLNIYNAADNFLSSTYQPLLEQYDDLLNLNVEYIGGDGQTESGRLRCIRHQYGENRQRGFLHYSPSVGGRDLRDNSHLVF